MEQAQSMQADDTSVISLLERLRSEVYNDSNEQLALGMGRPVEEIENWLSGSEQIDEDAEFKIRGLADERLGGDSRGPEAAEDPNESIKQRL